MIRVVKFPQREAEGSADAKRISVTYGMVTLSDRKNFPTTGNTLTAVPKLKGNHFKDYCWHTCCDT